MNAVWHALHAQSRRILTAAGGLLALTACSSLPHPERAVALTGADVPDGETLVRQSAEQSGDGWNRLETVTIHFEGEWEPIVERLQPGLVDSGFRKSSVETYQPRAGRVLQRHSGPDGTKTVLRLGAETEVRYQREDGSEQPETDLQRSAAALVADAYAFFVFRSSWLADRGTGFETVGRRQLDGEACWLVRATVEPGFGDAAQDQVIVWIGEESQRTRRVQLTLNGLESTAMADVDVTFTDFRKGPQGTEWPRHYLEWVQRPIRTPAHEWWMTDLAVEARP